MNSNNTLWVIVGILAIIALLLFIFSALNNNNVGVIY